MFLSIVVVYIIIKGYAQTSWEETKTETKYRNYDQSQHQQTVLVKYNGQEEYLESRMVLFGQLNGEPVEISAGTHKYEFECELKDSLPASYYDENSEIAYVVNAILDVSGESENIKKNFTVVRRDNPAHYSDLTFPASNEEVKTFSFCCCNSEPLFMNVSIPYSIFSVGQSVPIRVKYLNRSNEKISFTKFKLERKIEYKAHAPERKSKSNEEILLIKTERGVKARRDEEFIYDFNIPASLPTSIERFCTIIKISYKLVVEALYDGMFFDNIVCEFPIVLISRTNQVNANFIESPVSFPSAPPISTVLVDEDDDLRENLLFINFKNYFV
jgi:Arrestin (or S-antigen), C-terminal domain/Arrestin (or S-antigen), N-terminal domain